MKEDFEDISIEDIFKEINKNHNNKKRKTKDEREREKEKRINEREIYKSYDKDRLFTLKGLRNEIYTLIYEYDILNFESNLKTLNEIYESEDIETLEKIMKDSSELIKLNKNSLLDDSYTENHRRVQKITTDAFKTIKLYQGKQSIINFIERNEDVIIDILKSIKTVEESDVIYEALIGTEHITLLPKGYSEAKKYKIKYRNKKYQPLTYEKALRRNRHYLETYLKEIGVGQQRAQKISQILMFL